MLPHRQKHERNVMMMAETGHPLHSLINHITQLPVQVISSLLIDIGKPASPLLRHFLF
jgi:hypothetical protein